MWVGDKSPRLFYSLDHINRKFPTAHVIVIVRRNPHDVASSYQVRARNAEDKTWPPSRDYKLAVKQWNAAAKHTLAFLDKRGRRAETTVVEYSELFEESAAIDKLFARLDLEVTIESRIAYDSSLGKAKALSQSRRTVLSEEESQYVRANADTEIVERLLERRLRIN